MKKTLVSLGIILLGTLAVSAQPQTDRERAGLIGPVRTVRIEAVRVPDPAGRPSEVVRAPAQAFSFDERGSANEKIYYRLDGTVERRIGWDYTYDAAGRQIERRFYNTEGALTNRAVYAYDGSGRRAAATHYNPDGSVNHTQRYEYDNNGDKVRETHRNPDGSLRNIIITVYDTERRTKEISFYRPDETLAQRSIYTYDEQGRETGWQAYNRTGGVGINISRSYDARGNITESRSCRGEEVAGRETYTYEFDSRGNWIRRHLVREEIREGRTSNMLETLSRVITYY